MSIASGSRADRPAGAQHHPGRPPLAPPQQALPRSRPPSAHCTGSNGGFEGREGHLPPVSRRERTPTMTPKPEGARDTRAGPAASAQPAAERRPQSAGPRGDPALPQAAHPAAEDDAGSGGGPAAVPDAPASPVQTTPPPPQSPPHQQQHQQRCGASGLSGQTALVPGSCAGAKRALQAVKQVEDEFRAAQAAGSSEAAEQLQVRPRPARRPHPSCASVIALRASQSGQVLHLIDSVRLWSACNDDA